MMTRGNLLRGQGKVWQQNLLLWLVSLLSPSISTSQQISVLMLLFALFQVLLFSCRKSVESKSSNYSHELLYIYIYIFMFDAATWRIQETYL